MGTEVDIDAEVGAGGAEATFGVGVLTGLAFSCEDDANVAGEPGLGGSDGCMGELPAAGTGRGAARFVLDVVSGPEPDSSGFVSSFDSDTTIEGGAFAGVLLALAAEAMAAALFLARAAIFSSLCLRILIRASSCLIFFTKSFTSPALFEQNECRTEPLSSHEKNETQLEWVLQIVQFRVTHVPNIG